MPADIIPWIGNLNLAGQMALLCGVVVLAIALFLSGVGVGRRFGHKFGPLRADAAHARDDASPDNSPADSELPTLPDAGDSGAEQWHIRAEAAWAVVSIQQAADAERRRIAADLHDDVGAKLLTIIHSSREERTAALAREALEEMRLSVRGLSGRPMRLGDALADWRAEVVTRLLQAADEVNWHCDSITEGRGLSARVYVQTTRILREAVSNIIRHSQASACMVHCAVNAGVLHIVIQDNGCGMPGPLSSDAECGHGIAGMKRRARQMQGQCLIESNRVHGTLIRITVPL